MHDDTDDTPTAWLEQHAHPLEDLQVLRDIAADAQVVALGLSARDTHQLSVTAHRVLRFLVEELGFRALALEGDDVTSAALDEYVQTGTGDPVALLADARPFLRIAEVLDTIRWIRRHNELHPTGTVRVAHPEQGDWPEPGDLGVVEKLLADNTIRWYERTGLKTVYWGGMAHTVNGRTRTVAPATPPATHRSAGSHLRERFGAGYLSIGLTFHHGAESHPAPPPPEDFAEAVLNSTARRAYLLHLGADRPERVRAWLEAPAKTRLIGPGYDPAEDAAHHLSGGSLADWFDVVIHHDEVTTARPLPGSPS